MYLYNLLYLSLICATSLCDGYKVLVVFPTPVKSHGILGNGVVKHLLDAGHEVTYITPYPNILKQHPLLDEIDVSSLCKLIPEELFSIDKSMKKEIDLSDIQLLVSIFIDLQVNVLKSENVINLLSDRNKTFHVVVLEWMFTELISGLSTVFNCPYIWFATLDPNSFVLKLIDELPNPAYTTSILLKNAEPLSFWQRAEELLQTATVVSWQYFYLSSIEQRHYELLIAPFIRNHKVPDFDAVRYNVSLILGNSHVTIGKAISLPQNYKQIGGFHIDDKVDPLPMDLKKILDNAKFGLIYFSLGSGAKSKFMPAAIKVSLLKMFGKLKQTVLWKFEEDLPDKPRNVHTVKWAPQHSILAHPNCILFISHGGLLSVTESIHFGKPMIGIPIYGDQFSNVLRSVKRGYMKRVDMSFTIADELESAIKDIISNPSYTAKAKELSFAYHDRPMSPGKELIYWVEHVVRTGGAPHLRSPALMVPWYQKCYLDLAALVIFALYAVILVIKTLMRRILRNNAEKIKLH